MHRHVPPALLPPSCPDATGVICEPGPSDDRIAHDPDVGSRPTDRVEYYHDLRSRPRSVAKAAGPLRYAAFGSLSPALAMASGQMFCDNRLARTPPRGIRLLVCQGPRLRDRSTHPGGQIYDVESLSERRRFLKPCSLRNARLPPRSRTSAWPGVSRPEWHSQYG